MTNTFLYCPGVLLALGSIVAAETSTCSFFHSVLSRAECEPHPAPEPSLLLAM